MEQENKSENKPTENINNGNQPEAVSLVERVDANIKRLEETEKRVNERIAELDALESKRLIGGRSLAGTPPKTKEQEDQEEIQRQIDRRIKQFK